MEMPEDAMSAINIQLSGLQFGTESFDFLPDTSKTMPVSLGLNESSSYAASVAPSVSIAASAAAISYSSSSSYPAAAASASGSSTPSYGQASAVQQQQPVSYGAASYHRSASFTFLTHDFRK